MKKLKRLVSAMLTAVIAAAMMTSCGADAGSGAGTGGGTTDLLLWMPPYAADGEALDQEWWSETLSPWATENNVNLTIEIIPWGNYSEKYLTAFSSGQGPDVGYMYQEMYNDFIDMGALEPLGQYFSEEDTADYIYYDMGMIKGDQYALPMIVGNARVLFFNMDILEKAGVTELPSTWDELVDVCKKIKDSNQEGVIPFGQGWAEPSIGGLNEIYYPYMWQAGGDIFDENGEIALMKNDGAVKAAQFLYDLRFTHEVLVDATMGLTGSDVRDQFEAGKVGVIMGSTNYATRFDNAGVNWDFVASLEDEQKGTMIAADALIMNSASKNKELAADLMKYMTSPDIMEKFHKEISAFPPINKSEEYLDNERFAEMYETADFLKVLPVAPNSFKVMDTLFKNMQSMMLGDLTPEQAIQQTVDYANSVG